MKARGGEPRSQERSHVLAEQPVASVLRRPRRVRRLGRVRIPITLVHRPWATLYQYPDGRLLWCVRLWQDGRVVPRLLPTAVLRRYARRSGLAAFAQEMDALLAHATGEARVR